MDTDRADVGKAAQSVGQDRFGSFGDGKIRIDFRIELQVGDELVSYDPSPEDLAGKGQVFGFDTHEPSEGLGEPTHHLGEGQSVACAGGFEGDPLGQGCQGRIEHVDQT